MLTVTDAAEADYVDVEAAMEALSFLGIEAPEPEPAATAVSLVNGDEEDGASDQRLEEREASPSRDTRSHHPAPWPFHR